MDKLRGSGNTFSTSGRAWMPFQYSPSLAKQKQRLHRLKRKGLTPPADKAAARQLIEAACAIHPIRRIPSLNPVNPVISRETATPRQR
jgi:hypothetical protein